MFYPVIDLTPVMKDKVINIIQVGAGGNGGYLCQKIARTISTMKKNTVKYIIIDADVVETKNLQRQPYIKEDVGEAKAAVLSERYSDAYDIDIRYKDIYVYSTDDLLDYYDKDAFNILIGAVDNNATRQIMHNFFMEVDDLCYIDGGIDDVSGETPEEIAESGYTGQVVCGLKSEGLISLDPVGLIYQNILSDKSSRLPGLSCGDTAVSYPQRMQTNEFASLIMQSYVQNILYDAKIVSHQTNFNALTMNSRPVFIENPVILSAC